LKIIQAIGVNFKYRAKNEVQIIFMRSKGKLRPYMGKVI
jgi:hypothetical protein